MGFYVLRRVRWGNVGRALAAVVLVAAVVAWPRLTTPAPRVPGSATTPLVAPRPPVVREPQTRAAAPARKRRQVGRRRDGRGRHYGGKRQGARRRRARRPKSPSVELSPVEGDRPTVERPSEPVVTPRAVPPPVDPAQTEFGFEGG